MKYWAIAATVATTAVWAASASAQQAPPNPEACTSITSDALRLACYDRALGRTPPPDTAIYETPRNRVPIHTPPPKPAGHEHSLFNIDKPARARSGTATAVAGMSRAPSISLLDSRWELSPNSKLGTFNVRGYKPVYLLPVFYTTNVNNTPHSPSPDHTAGVSQKLDKLEAMFQISFKTKVWQGVFGNHGDLWFAYTQTSHWQVYNGGISRPFRETNYEPEAMLVFNTDYDVLGWKGRLLGIGVNHQSNGRSNPLSRSWNRIIADFGFERPGWTIMFRPWIRINETSSHDDNPDIEDYMGRGSVQIVHEAGGYEFSLLLRHSLRSGERSHGAMRFTWAFPIHAKLRGYVQVFRGYGESLIDYNHRATYVGIGVSLLGWY
ncbi:MAG TPA: phospholipase A [Rhodanobacteraceae bacterium]|nr:phospholipase A [Rhodanobacteraceae bacterium]